MDWWEGEEKPTGRLRVKMPEGMKGNSFIQQEWLVITADNKRHTEWRSLPVVPFEASDKEE